MFKQYETTHPSLAKVYSIGQSVQGKELLVLQITSGADKPREMGKPMLKWVAKMHGKEAVGMQLVMFMAKYLLANHGHGGQCVQADQHNGPLANALLPQP